MSVLLSNGSHTAGNSNVLVTSVENIGWIALWKYFHYFYYYCSAADLRYVPAYVCMHEQMSWRGRAVIFLNFFFSITPPKHFVHISILAQRFANCTGRPTLNSGILKLWNCNILTGENDQSSFLFHSELVEGSWHCRRVKALQKCRRFFIWKCEIMGWLNRAVY